MATVLDPIVAATTVTTLYGTPASAGSVTGRAHVAQDVLDDPPLPGEVLVTHTLSAVRLPLFPSLAAVVAETGNALCDGAIVARELHIPAVVGLPDATRRIARGDIVAVDGLGGVVEIVRHAL
jgi:pyruvate,water dikinase